MGQRIALLANLIVPGCGLIALRRAWSGFALAVLFGVLGQIAIFGLWIVPRDIPRWASWGSLFAAGGVWIFAQRLAWVRHRQVTSPELACELEGIRQRAAEALSRGVPAEAHRALVVALDLDDEDIETLALWARYGEAIGRPCMARCHWKRVLSLVGDGPQAAEARAALKRL